MKQAWKLAVLIIAGLPLAASIGFGQATIIDVQGAADYGRAVSCAGDVNGDSYPDIAVGNDIAGTIDILSGTDGSLIRQLSLSTIVANFSNLPSYTIDTIGDLNSDGFDDLLVGRVGDALVGLAGVVPLGPGGTQIFSGADGSVLQTQSPLSGEQSFGYATAVIDDVDGDGKADYVVAAPWASTQGLFDNGYFSVFSGGTGALLYSVHGQSSSIRLGQSLASAGDVDGDGAGDFVVGSTAGSGSLIVYSGATGAQSLVLQAGSLTLSPSFGLGYPDIEVAAGADVDGDGVGDYVLAKRGDETHGFRAGAIFVFSGATNQIIHSWFGQPCDGIGAKIELIDVNADGNADVLSASRNDAGHDDDVTVFSGVTGVAKFDTDTVTNDMTQLAVVGDVDGDGVADFLGSTDPTGLNPGRVLVVAGGPWLGQGAIANVTNLQGQEEIHLTVNGGVGGPARRVDLEVGTSFSFEIAQPTGNAVPAGFVIFGQIGAPAETDVISLPNAIGDFTIYPVPLVPWAQPLVFTLASSLGPVVGGEILPATLAPWNFQVSGGLNFQTTFTLQGVIEDGAGNLKATNGLIVRVR